MQHAMFPLLFQQPAFLSGFLIVLLIVLVLLTIVGIFYLYINAKSKERLALIERGMDPNLARSDFLTQVAIIGGGFATGLIVADKIGSNAGPLVGIMVAAVALVVFTVYKRKRSQKTFNRRDEQV